MLAADTCDVALAVADILAAFQYDGPYARLNQTERSKESARTCPDDNGLRGVCYQGIADGSEGECGRVFVEPDFQRKVYEYRALAGVDASALQTNRVDGRSRHLELLRNVRPKACFVVGYIGCDPELEGSVHADVLEKNPLKTPTRMPTSDRARAFQPQKYEVFLHIL